jgi:predicted nucleic acid-binding protein
VRLLTLDASVLCKWFLDPSVEEDVGAARSIAAALHDQRIAVIQPPHWIAEIGAVAARRVPDDAEAIVSDFARMGLAVVEDEKVYRRAARLAIETGTHLFDTLYHATALENTDCTFVTADRRYFDAACQHGQIAMLGQFSLPKEPCD